MANLPKLGLRVVWQFLLVLLMIMLAWRILSLGMADARVLSVPQDALQWRPQHSAALYLQAEQQSKNPGLVNQAKQNATAALRSYPFEGRAYRVLGQLAESENKPELALDLFQKAERYSPRDLESHLWLLNYCLRTEDAVAAVKHLDILLRLQPTLFTQLAPTVTGLATYSESQAAMLDAMAKKPAWRSNAILLLASQRDAAKNYAQFFNELAKSKGGLNAAEHEAWLGALNRSQLWSLAYLNWASQLPPETQLALGNLFNGSFEHEPLGGEFDWQFDQIPGVMIDRAFRDGVKGDVALRIRFDDRQIPFKSIRQTLVLPAGHYRFSGQGLAEDLRTELGLVWSVQCLGSGTSLVNSEPWKGNSLKWISFSVVFEVTPANCPAQELFLQLPAKTDSERAIGGSIWFDALRIQRIQRLTEQKPNRLIN